jgi:hypothetical protein
MVRMQGSGPSVCGYIKHKIKYTHGTVLSRVWRDVLECPVKVLVNRQLSSESA